MKYLLTLPVFLLAFSSIASAHPSQFHTQAVEGTTSENGIEEEKSRGEEVRAKFEEYRAAAQERKLTNLRELCTRMVDHRVRSLESTKARISSSKLSDEQKQELATLIDQKMAEVRATDCTSPTSLDALRTLLRSLEKKVVFASILPRIRAERFLARVQGFIGRLTNHVAAIEKHIDKAKDAGCDTADAEAALADYQAAVQSAQDHLNLGKDVIASFKDTEDPGAKRAELKTHMTEMKNALLEARDAHKKIVSELKECRAKQSEEESETEPTEPTPSPTPSP